MPLHCSNFSVDCFCLRGCRPEARTQRPSCATVCAAYGLVLFGQASAPLCSALRGVVLMPGFESLRRSQRSRLFGSGPCIVSICLVRFQRSKGSTSISKLEVKLEYSSESHGDSFGTEKSKDALAQLSGSWPAAPYAAVRRLELLRFY